MVASRKTSARNGTPSSALGDNADVSSPSNIDRLSTPGEEPQPKVQTKKRKWSRSTTASPAKRALRRRVAPSPTPMAPPPASSIIPAPKSEARSQALSLTSSASVIISPRPDGTTELIDLDHKSHPLPLKSTPRFFKIRLVSAIEELIQTQYLISTPSDFRSIIVTPDFCLPGEEEDYINSQLRSFGLECEPDVRTILGFLHNGRFNSAVHNEPRGQYSIDRSVSLLSLASRYAMIRVVELILMEMSREFLAAPVGKLDSPIDIPADQLRQMSAVMDDGVKAWLRQYVIELFTTNAGVRPIAKEEVEKVLTEPADAGEGEGTMLHRLVMTWFQENPNPGRFKREGELARLRAMRPKRLPKGDGRQRDLATSAMTGSEASPRVLATSPASRVPGTQPESTAPPTRGTGGKRIMLRIKFKNQDKKDVDMDEEEPETLAPAPSQACMPPDTTRGDATSQTSDASIMETDTLTDGPAPDDSGPTEAELEAIGKDTINATMISEFANLGARNDYDVNGERPILTQDELDAYCERMAKAHPLQRDCREL